MYKKLKNIIIITSLLLLPFVSFADNEPPAQSSKKGNFSETSFSTDNKWNKDGTALAPPNANDAGTTGSKAPISGGLWILIAGSTFYFAKRIRKELK